MHRRPYYGTIRSIIDHDETSGGGLEYVTRPLSLLLISTYCMRWSHDRPSCLSVILVGFNSTLQTPEYSARGGGLQASWTGPLAQAHDTPMAPSDSSHAV